MDADFEELSHDTDIITRIKQFRDITLKIEDTIKYATDPAIYEKLSNTDKIEYNLLMSYCLNSMFWMYLRAEGKIKEIFNNYTIILNIIKYCVFLLNILYWFYLGIDPAKHRIKLENDRLKKSMTRAKQINDRKTLMPHINKDAAQRFVRNGLWEIKNKKK